ncbi:nuclear transport factor 2 family protein [Streptomyces sp. NBC_00121]|uniref:YybH family protein n=1 Tax=unclassified Streptomyces TaxID=2593676 RepID=UPI002DD925FF|nr:nuclear transport factor 2 family protein [Streptomyces sp. NBC_01760]WSC74034.1 nuclear transport factor 2 family protein [Streptomyces sp. NBC_01760]
MPQPTAPLAEFIRTYEQAANSHDITQLVPLIAPDAVYWFSDGSHRGRKAILSAIAYTFATIHDEIYQIDDLEWIVHSDDHAVCRYRFTWTGTIDGRPRSGSGRGTNVLVNNAGTWQMLHEHLSACDGSTDPQGLTITSSSPGVRELG